MNEFDKGWWNCFLSYTDELARIKCDFDMAANAKLKAAGVEKKEIETVLRTETMSARTQNLLIKYKKSLESSNYSEEDLELPFIMFENRVTKYWHEMLDRIIYETDYISGKSRLFSVISHSGVLLVAVGIILSSKLLLDMVGFSTFSIFDETLKLLFPINFLLFFLLFFLIILISIILLRIGIRIVWFILHSIVNFKRKRKYNFK